MAPDRHGEGIGSALVCDATARAEATGAPLVVLEGSPQCYRRFGFEHSVRYGIDIDLPSWAPTEAAQVIRLRDNDGKIRGRLVYPPAFHAALEH